MFQAMDRGAVEGAMDVLFILITTTPITAIITVFTGCIPRHKSMDNTSDKKEAME